MFYNCDKITTFREVFEYIIYDWDNLYTLSKDKEGIFYVNKLCIGPNFVTYKTDCHELADGLYDRVSQLYDIMQKTPRKPSDDAYNRLVDEIQDRLDRDKPTCNFMLDDVPLEERKMLVKDFEEKGYRTFLYMDDKSIRILEK